MKIIKYLVAKWRANQAKKLFLVAISINTMIAGSMIWPISLLTLIITITTGIAFEVKDSYKKFVTKDADELEIENHQLNNIVWTIFASLIGVFIGSVSNFIFTAGGIAAWFYLS